MTIGRRKMRTNPDSHGGQFHTEAAIREFVSDSEPRQLDDRTSPDRHHAQVRDGPRRGSKLPGMPDFVLPRARGAVFVVGDFWHGSQSKSRVPKSNQIYWEVKIRRKMARPGIAKAIC